MMVAVGDVDVFADTSASCCSQVIPKWMCMKHILRTCQAASKPLKGGHLGAAITVPRLACTGSTCRASMNSHARASSCHRDAVIGCGAVGASFVLIKEQSAAWRWEDRQTGVRALT
jgi:hypothetical protein